MTHAWTFETAVALWSGSRQNPEEVWDAFESAEQFLLDHRPQTVREAVRMMEVIVEQGGDRRCDGRDVEALGRIHLFLQQLAGDEAAPVAAVRAVA